MISYSPGTCATFASWSAIRAVVRSPVFRRSLLVSLLGGIIAIVIGEFQEQIGLKKHFAGGEPLVFASVMSIMGFLFVFRMSQAYGRFCSGSDLVFQMAADFYDATHICISLARSVTESDPEALDDFSATLVRLASLLSAVCYNGLASHEVGDNDSDQGFMTFLASVEPLTIDILGLDASALRDVAESKCRPERLYQMFHHAIVDALHSGVLKGVQPPLLTRVFQELGTGMLKYHEAFKLVHIPYPFPLMALSEIALLIHWTVCPFAFALWCKNPFAAGFLTCVVDMILWSMVALASEFDNPFGNDMNDLDANKIQRHLNHSLASLKEHCDAKSPCLNKAMAKPITADDYKNQRHRANSTRVSISLTRDESKGEVLPDDSMVVRVQSAMRASEVADELQNGSDHSAPVSESDHSRDAEGAANGSQQRPPGNSCTADRGDNGRSTPDVIIPNGDLPAGTPPSTWRTGKTSNGISGGGDHGSDVEMDKTARTEWC